MLQFHQPWTAANPLAAAACVACYASPTFSMRKLFPLSDHKLAFGALPFRVSLAYCNRSLSLAISESMVVVLPPQQKLDKFTNDNTRFPFIVVCSQTTTKGIFCYCL